MALKIGLVVAALFCFYIAYQTFLVKVGDIQDKTFEVVRGDNFMDIGRNLKAAGFIKSRLVFDIAVLARGNFLNLKAGQYIFESGDGLLKIVDKMEKGETVLGSNETTVVISEGQNLDEISRRLEATAAAGINLKTVKASRFEADFPWLGHLVNFKYDSLEGFLFPDTYRVDKNADADSIIKKILANFERKTADFMTEAARSDRDFHDVLVLASILEKEVPPADMPLAAGVLWRRLELGMPLQADATLVYVLNRPIVKSDTVSLASPYNTYRYKELPPTPISNPGLAALEAAARPQKNDYLYYLSRPHDGGTVFSKTLEEHNLAKAKYLGN